MEGLESRLTRPDIDFYKIRMDINSGRTGKYSIL